MPNPQATEGCTRIVFGYGVDAESGSSYGIYAQSNGSNAVFGQVFGSSAAVWGQGFSGDGVHGTTGGATSAGVSGDVPAANSGSAIVGDAHGSWTAWAGNYNGDVQARGFFTTSDARLKNDVTTLPGGLEQLRRLRPVSYKWKHDGASGTTQVGLIAQEVQQVFPSFIRSDAKTAMLSVNYTQLIPVLIRAVQEQQTIIEQQQAKIQTWEQQQRPAGASMFSVGPFEDVMLIVGAFGVVTVLLRRSLRKAPTERL